MRTVAIIPARGGSKGIPGKNLRLVGGRSLIERAVRSCRAARLIDQVYVSTDDPDIAKAARLAGADVVHRPADLAADQASSESALLHAVDRLAEQDLAPDVVAFVQCTSPFINPDDLDAGVELIISDQADSVFAGVESYQFLWRDDDESITPAQGTVHGQNHDTQLRPRRQDRRPDFRETGAFYVMRTTGLKIHRHRFFGRTKVVPVAEATSLEIDTFPELALANAVAQIIEPSPTSEFAETQVVVTDFDGVHTADTAYIDQEGHETVRVSRSDGLGVSQLRKAGIGFLILSTERNPVVSARATKLGVEVLQGIEDKATVLRDWLAERGYDPARTVYVGNDVNDLGPLGLVGWPVAVPEAHPAVLAVARIVLSHSGGAGAVREVCDRVIASATAPSAAATPVAGPAAAIPVPALV